MASAASSTACMCASRRYAATESYVVSVLEGNQANTAAQKEKSDRATIQFLRRLRHRNAARFCSYRSTRSLWPDLAASALVQLSAVLLFSWSLISSYPRSEERRVGQECVSTVRCRWAPDHENKKKKKKMMD